MAQISARRQAMDTQDDQPPLPLLLGRATRHTGTKGSMTSERHDIVVKLGRPMPGIMGDAIAVDEADTYPARLWEDLEKYFENLARLVRSTASRSQEAGGPNPSKADAPHVFRGGCTGMAIQLHQRLLAA